MQASERWTRLEGFAPDLRDEVQLFWAEFHTDDDGANPDRRELIRFMQDPTTALHDLDLGSGRRVEEDWQVHSTFANHGFGVFWQRCLVALMVSPAERLVVIHAWKVRPPSKHPPGYAERQADPVD
jgi:hypothetical protein